VAAGEPGIDALTQALQHAPSSEARAAAVWALFRIGTPRAEQGVRTALDDPSFRVRISAARAAGMARDLESVGRLMQMVKQDQPAARRQAATALGQIGDARAATALLAAAARPSDRFNEHSVTYALIELKTPGPALEALKSTDPKIRKTALIALDQMDGSPLTASHLTPLLSDRNKELRTAALGLPLIIRTGLERFSAFSKRDCARPSFPPKAPTRFAMPCFRSAPIAAYRKSSAIGSATLPRSVRCSCWTPSITAS
jgi:HEAT repeat protein